MTKILSCNDVVPGCEAEVRADTDEDVLRQAVAHARSEHGLAEIDDATAQQIKASIRTI